jgi:glycosyltransferase involved in cell wall biosynthesis
MVTPLYLPHIGGVERYVYELSGRLARSGLDITVLTTDPTGELPRSEQDQDVHVLRVPTWPRQRDYYLSPEIYRTVANGDWDVVHVQSYHTFVAPLAMAAARRRNIPYVVTFHGGGHSAWSRRIMRRPQWALLRPLLASAERLVALAQFEIDDYSRRLRVPRARFVLIPLATNFSRIQGVRTVDAPSEPVIASPGRLERYKGHHRLIEALPYILERRPEIRVWIAGAGPYEERLRRLATKLGVEDRVEIRAIPASEPERMARELAVVALVVLLSEYETQPAVALEAIALGRPVLVLYMTGLIELADRGLASSVSPASTPREIAHAVLEQLADPFVPARVELPSWEDCAARHIELYLTVFRS